MNNDIFTVATVNFNAIHGEKYYNCKRIGDFMKRSAERGVQLILFPEMALTGYTNETDKPKTEKMQYLMAETLQGECVIYLAELAKEYKIYAVFGMPERDPENKDIIYNSAVVVGPEGVIGSYRKIHPALEETAWCTKGTEPFMFDTPAGRIGIGICYDSYKFHELVRYYTMEGTRIFLNPTALCAFEDYENYYKVTLGQIVNTFDQFVISSNLTGIESPQVLEGGSHRMFGLEKWTNFPGGSMIMGPGVNDRIHIYSGGTEYKEEQIFMETLDLSISRRCFHKKNPLTEEPDVRPYIYRDMMEHLLTEENAR